MKRTVFTQKRKIGIALGGGGARGFAHLGVLKVLESAGIKPDILVGTSMGSFIGALYVQLQSASLAEAKLRESLEQQESAAHAMNVYPANQKGDHFFEHVSQEIKQRLIINLSISRKSLMSAERLETAVSSLIDDINIENLPVTFAAMASDLTSGKGVVIKGGPLRKAVVASSSIPGFFPPVKWDSYLLADGEVTDLIPVDACRALGADFVIAVDVRRDIQPPDEMRHTIDIFIRSARITGYRFSEIALQRADFIIRPISKDVQWSEFDRLNEIIKTGEWEARAKLPELTKVLEGDIETDDKRILDDFSRTHIELASFSEASQ